MRRAAAALALLLAVACRTARPAGEEAAIAPLTSSTPDAAARELSSRSAQLQTERALLRIRATNGERTQSFRAQLVVDGRGDLQLSAYTPIGTTALEIYERAGEVTFINHLESTWWRGSAADFSRAFGFFGSVAPSTMALLITGLPGAADRGIAYEYGAAGLARATVGDAIVTFEPPVYPPRHVTIARGAQRLDVEMLEAAMTTATVPAADVPKDYRCCVAPRL
jgi:hypothetical protein